MENILTIGVCDDEIIIISILVKKIKIIMYYKKINFAIKTFLSGEELIKQIDKLDLVFLDIEMPELDGIETGSMIRRLNKECQIIMATSRTDRFKESFKINAFRFITKPFEDGELREVIEDYLNLRLGMNTIVLYKDRIPYEVKQNDIKYILAYDGYSEHKVKNNMLRKESSLNELEAQLNEKLYFRVNRTCIVNFRWIREYKNGMIILDDLTVKVSRRRKKSFESALMEFDLNYR